MTPKKDKINICLIVDCLTKGGAERIAAMLSNKLTKLGYNVFIICLRNEVSYSYQGQLFNLGVNESKFKLIKQFKKLIGFKKAYKEINANVYIDFRMRNRFFMEWLLHKYVFNIEKMIMTIHSHNILYHMPASKYFFNQYNKSKAIVGVSEGVCHRMLDFFNFKNLKCISNFYERGILNSKSSKEHLTGTNEFIVAVGRLSNSIKQFDKLIYIYKESVLIDRGVSLLIIGEGPDKDNLQNIIDKNNLGKWIKLVGFKNNVYPYLKSAKFLVLSSKFEGFPNVILESLALGTPVISFNCKSGPSEMVVDGLNGMLVEDQNFAALKTAMNKMISDEGFYEQCKINAASSVTKFSEDEIISKWIKLISC